MTLFKKSALVIIILTLCFINSKVICEQEENVKSSTDDNPHYKSFITARMRHLTAISDLKTLTNDVKRHKVILDVSRNVFKMLDERKKALPSADVLANLSETSPLDALHQKVFAFLESTAFFCDLLVFFPDTLSRVIEKNLRWRVTLIDSIQAAVSLNINFVDQNTYTQFEKANQILSEGVPPLEVQKVEKKKKDTKKAKRKPRLTSNEL